MSKIRQAACLLLSISIASICGVAMAQGDDAWTGRTVLTLTAEVALHPDNGPSATLKDWAYEVKACSVDKLLIKDIDGRDGWVRKADLVLESEALDVLTKRLRSAPTALAYHRRALAWYRRHDFEIAQQDLKAAIALDPRAAYLHQLKGVIHAARREYYDALSALDFAIRLDPYQATAYRDRGNVLLKQGDVRGARRSFSQAVRVLPTFAEAYVLRAEALESRQFGEEWIDRKIAGLSDAIRMDPNYAEAYLSRGTAYSKKENGDRKALADFDSAVRLRPDYALAHYNRGVIYRRLGRHDLAAAAYGEAVRCAPTWDEAYWRRAYCFEQLAQWTKALADHDTAIRLKPRQATYYHSRARVHRALGNLTAAASDEAEYDRLSHSQEERKTIPYLDLAKASIRDGDYDEAIESLTKYLTHAAPNSGSVIDPGMGHQLRGEAYLGKKEYDRAIYDFTRAIPYDDPHSLRCRAVAFRQAGKTESAIADLTALLVGNSSDTAALFDRASLHASSKRYDWAIADLEKALQVRPDWDEARRLLGNLQTTAIKEKDDPSTKIVLLNQANKSFDTVYAIVLPRRTYLLKSSTSGKPECYLTARGGRLSETSRPAAYLLPGSVLRGDRIGGPVDRYYTYSEQKTWKRSEGPEVYHFQEDAPGGDRFTELPPLSDE
jgi:tetratricopeptide (TPR) repeat protein